MLFRFRRVVRRDGAINRRTEYDVREPTCRLGLVLNCCHYVGDTEGEEADESDNR